MTTFSPGWRLVVHGGAGSVTRARTDAAVDGAIRSALAAALDAGGAILAADGSAIDAVEAAVRVLEDDAQFNAGRGAALTLDGTIELDAAIMDGATLAAGSVAGLTATRNPIGAARAVMEHSPHVLLAGPGADSFSREAGIEQAGPDWFVTPDRRLQLAELKARSVDAFDIDMKYGTVGAVAIDGAGHVAAATSTGGVTGKRPGRIGDSPLIGAGTYADDRGAAISCTGAGEFFIRAAAAAQVNARIRLLGEEPGAAAAAVMAEISALGGTGGAIVIGSDGRVAWRFTTPSLYRGRTGADSERVVALYDDEP
ncbi:isoaspartyl peptidase/L-asparaginase family protein [uncultured Sphingomonas sp.]|uniref:isoaspartyl peptidase/L-asparaginase family protein n=1 Tax=uncultured Sphingomonas sp. TaxID=158754 RepID=UPI0035CB17EA